MFLILAFVFLVAVTAAPAQTTSRDAHLREAGSNTLFAHSAFAHGYRHGYEEGYHLGNIDINMGRPLRTKSSQFHDLPHGYSQEFGSKKSFESGFLGGVKAGYADGYAGRRFRAVESLRLLADSLSETSTTADPHNLYFDQGFSSGYDRGLTQGQLEMGDGRQIDFRFVSCEQLPAREKNVAADASFCEGYRRGFTLGKGDAVALRPEHGSLAANK